ncbi:LacI family DNA-binding transcriptional regulator [Pseudarthrobacter sulfonivorans]|uniref:LacI family DNA-binding transcriptional regulator n=1 Tax=Pseudarthrobacter sulfonivorans TaxID=121292 RepID=UPI002105D9E1|nr:LacI family DNA-binding transcriptional regulator [Pseudarthrobacter sulfonivorans]
MGSANSGGKTIGIKEVAAAAGVSATTVSQALNEVASARISSETRERVRSVAGQLGYGPNTVARALRTSRTALLGLVIEDSGANPNAGQIMFGADQAARARGYNILVISTPGSAGPDERAADVGSLLARRVDGILYAPLRPRQLKLGNPGSIPVMVVAAEAGESAEPAELAVRAARNLMDAIEGATAGEPGAPRPDDATPRGNF